MSAKFRSSVGGDLPLPVKPVPAPKLPGGAGRVRRSLYDYGMPVARVLGRHPRIVGNLAGLSLSAGLLIAFLVSALHLRLQTVDEGHHRVLDHMRAVQDDTRTLLDELIAAYPPDCSEENLRRIRGLMFGHRHARNVGLLDEGGRLFCSTGLGLLANPAPPGSHGIDGSIGRYYLNTPVQRFVGPGYGALTATVVERGRFQVLVDRTPTSSNFAEYADAVWAGGGSQNRRIYQGPDGQDAPARIAPDMPHLHFDWQHIRLLVTNTAPGISPVSVQTRLGLHSIDTGRMMLLGGVVLVCLLVGYLAHTLVRRRCRHYASMDYRIRHLCTSANVVCHYQPILELSSGRMVGCEVLARLRDGEQLVYPDKFIPALNRQKLTWAFDAAVSRAALQELGAALPVGGRFAIALNFFPHNLRRDTIHAHLQETLREIDRLDLQIELEVTEYDFSPDLAPELTQLKADGYGISIDDFGTGYSNLGMVKKVSPDYLKIDRSFVFEMEDATLRSSLIPEIIAIARAVGSEVIAEGIETAAQEAQLRALGVQYGQGYFFARPMPLADLKRYIQDRA